MLYIIFKNCDFFGFYIFVSQKFCIFFPKLINAKFREKSENYCNFSQNYRTSFFNEIPYCFASKITFRDNVTKRKSLRNTKGNFAFSRMFLFAETQIYCVLWDSEIFLFTWICLLFSSLRFYSKYQKNV